MKANRLLLAGVVSSVAVAALGCAPAYVAPPPPPPAVAQAPPLIQLAERNGFEAGRQDGARAVESGYPYAARSTRAYFDTPGYDPNLGPFLEYQNAFRLAYLRGYDRGYRRG
jgi:hypothetical protein